MFETWRSWNEVQKLVKEYTARYARGRVLLIEDGKGPLSFVIYNRFLYFVAHLKAFLKLIVQGLLSLSYLLRKKMGNVGYILFYPISVLKAFLSAQPDSLRSTSKIQLISLWISFLISTVFYFISAGLDAITRSIRSALSDLADFLGQTFYKVLFLSLVAFMPLQSSAVLKGSSAVYSENLVAIKTILYSEQPFLLIMSVIGLLIALFGVTAVVMPASSKGTTH